MKKSISFLIFIFSIPAFSQVMGTPYMSLVSSDRTRAALVSAGCASCSAYDAAADNSLVAITATEYTSILNTVSGASLRGINNFTSITGLGTLNEIASGSVNYTALTVNSYIAAVAYSTYNGGNASIAITCSSSNTGTPFCLTGTSALLTYTAYSPRYFAVKKPTTHCGNSVNFGHITISGNGLSAGKSGGSLAYNNNNFGTCALVMSTSIAYVPAVQVVATTTKPW